MRYQVFEIPFGHLTDREQMRRHFFSIGRLLLDREEARSIRDNPAWFDSPLPDAAVIVDSWAEIVDLLDEAWHPLAAGLRASGLRPPTDVAWDIIVEGRVSGTQAIMMWDAADGTVLLIEESTAVPNGMRCIVASPNSEASLIATQVQLLVGAV
jgi:hypothetical protein